MRMQVMIEVGVAPAKTARCGRRWVFPGRVAEPGGRAPLGCGVAMAANL